MQQGQSVTGAADDQVVKHRLQVHFDTHQCELTDDEKASLADDTDLLARAVGNFPVAELRVLIRRGGRNNEFVVKLTLILPNNVIVSSDHEAVLHSAFERAMQSVLENVRAYKDKLGQLDERRRAENHTQIDLLPTLAVDFVALDNAVKAGDYAAFRAVLSPYDDALRARAGRWVERYPALQARMGKGMEVVDVVEEVLLMAFEEYEGRPESVPFGTWLENHLDPAVKALEAHPDEELENINMARAAVDAAIPPAPGA